MIEPLASDIRTADANGRAVCSVQPLRAFEDWRVTLTSVQSSSTTKIPSVKLYRGSETPTQFLDGSYSAQFNSSSRQIDLRNGERLIAVFENCDVGATCSLNVTGEKQGR